MPRATDWLDYAHKLDKEREAIADKLPRGVEVTLSLGAYGSGAANFHVRVTDAELTGHGMGRTPAKALADALEKLAAEREKQARRPRLAGGEPKALPVPRREVL